LRHLDVSQNHLQASIPDGIGQLAHIQNLDLSMNMLSGFIPSTIGNLSSLNSLSIGNNGFSGELSNLTFSKLSSLDILDLRRLSVVFQFDLDWVPPFQLTEIYLDNTNQGYILFNRGYVIFKDIVVPIDVCYILLELNGVS